ELYQRRLDERNAALARWTRRDRHVADARLLAFLTSILLALLIYRGAEISWAWVGAPTAILAVLVFCHEPIRCAGDRARRAVQFYSNGLARLDGRWAGRGTFGLEHLDIEHPYAADLDIFGNGSLFERLCTARTRAGEEALATWLLAPASAEAIRERHAAIVEL